MPHVSGMSFASKTDNYAMVANTSNQSIVTVK